MDGELEAQQALPITAQADGLQSFKEQWNWANCQKKLVLARPLRSARECVLVAVGRAQVGGFALARL